MEKTDIALVKRVQEGEETAFDELFSQLYKRIYYTAYRICKSDDDAKEVTQQTFIQVHRSIQNLHDVNTFDVWLHRIVVSKCYNLFGRRKDIAIDPDTNIRLKTEEEHRDYLMPHAHSHRVSDVELLNTLIDDLPDKYRILLVLAYFQEHTMEEVSTILEMPIGTVKSRLSTARNLLKRKINEYEKVEGIALDFHALSPAMLSMAFVYGFRKQMIPMPTVLGKSANLFHRSFSSSGHFAYVGVAAILSAVLAVSGYGIMHAVNQNIYLDQERALRYLDDEVIFQPVVLDSITYRTPQEAYYSLKVFAHCEEDMQKMSKSQLHHIKPLYDALKDSKSSYYLQLREIGWEQAYLKYL